MQSGVAGDQVWQFGPANTSIDPALIADDFTIAEGTAEFTTIATQHAADMWARTATVPSLNISAWI